MNYIKGDLVNSLLSGVILQQVNAQNAMGSGFAKAVFDRWPIVKTEFHRWSNTFQRDVDRMGRIQPIQVERDIWVVNIIGQRYFGRDGDNRYTSYDALADGLTRVSDWMNNTTFTSADVHHPAMGCGLGGGSWPVVEAMIEHHIGRDTTLWTLE
jgi:hypothetical protein